MPDTDVRKPAWLKAPLPGGGRYAAVRRAVDRHRLHTVCGEARCPNVGECWGAGTATFLILGDVCTRGCGFCAVNRGDPSGTTDAGEPKRVASSAAEMGLSFVVVTSVTRDDLPDGGASVFAETVRRVHDLMTRPRVEVLVPDYTGARLETVLDAEPEVLAHNLETVERLAPGLRHRRFTYGHSLEVLIEARGLRPGAVTKSSLLLGLGETDKEILDAMGHLRDAGVDLLVLGQYLQPTPAHAPVAEYAPPKRFDRLAEEGRRMGFRYVAADPRARTSYHAAEAYLARQLAEG